MKRAILHIACGMRKYYLKPQLSVCGIKPLYRLKPLSVYAISLSANPEIFFLTAMQITNRKCKFTLISFANRRKEHTHEERCTRTTGAYIQAHNIVFFKLKEIISTMYKMSFYAASFDLFILAPVENSSSRS